MSQWDFLKKKVDSGRIAHAYLFSGPEEVSKIAFAMELTHIVNCKEKGNCSPKCPHCKMIDSLNFPDVMVIRSKDSPSSIENGYDMMEISIEQIREAQNFLSYKPYYGNFKTVIIEDADRMSLEAQNCFLKNLEEPKGKALVILTSSKKDMIIPTVLSRCEEIKFFHNGDYEISGPEEKILRDILPLMKSDLAEKFQYSKKTNLEGESFRMILRVLEKYFRKLMMIKIGAVRPGGAGEKEFTADKTKEILKLIEKIAHQDNVSNLNRKMALEVLLMEL